jgi:phosphatidylglycerophosphate synthase
MKILWEWIQRGYLRVIEPIADFFVRKRVNPNTITTVGTCAPFAAGVIYATGHIKTAGWVLGLTALFDVLDGTVARRTGRSTVFGAFYDSTLDRVADGAVLGGLAIFFARNHIHHLIPSWAGTPMVGVILLGIIGTFLTSYTRARAESLGIDAKVGIMQRPERVTLLSAPQAFFGLVFNGWVLNRHRAAAVGHRLDHGDPAHRLRVPRHQIPPAGAARVDARGAAFHARINRSRRLPVNRTARAPHSAKPPRVEHRPGDILRAGKQFGEFAQQQRRSRDGPPRVLTPGLGAVATTFIAGVESVRRGLTKPIGSLTQMATIRLGKRTDKRSPLIRDFVPLASLDDIVFGAWDPIPDDAYTAAKKAGVLEDKHLEPIADFLRAIKPMPAVFENRYVTRINGTNVKQGKTKRDLAEQLRHDIREFKAKHSLDRVVASGARPRRRTSRRDRRTRPSSSSKRPWSATTMRSRRRCCMPGRASWKACRSAMGRRTWLWIRRRSSSWRWIEACRFRGRTSRPDRRG